MDYLNYFSPDYRTARGKFLDAAAAAGAQIETFENPATAPDGDAVFTDVALLGDAAADNVLMANSATHGVEGFCGSGAMVGWLSSGEHRSLPENVRAVLIHALNPHGFAWLRRVTEDNVDLNRNFIDHGAVHRANPEYSQLHPHLLPERWDEAALAASEKVFADYIAEHGEFALQAAISRGQYEHEDGVFFGGKAATWSNRTFREILARFVKGAKRVAFLDFHTGLGPYGTAEIIAGASPGSALWDRLHNWYGNGIASPAAGNSSSPALSGTIGGCVRRTLDDSEVTSVTVEYGTYPIRDVLYSLLADNWLHLKGDLDSDLGRSIKADVRKRLYPDEDDWKELVYVRARQILRRAARGLGEA